MLAILDAVDRPILVHYGSYESVFLERMCERYGEPPENSVSAKAIKDAINLISVMFARVYFPTFSNSLKEIARYCGYRWSDPSASGLQAIRWRNGWAASEAPALKLLLLKYNAEDCSALEIVTGKIIELSQAVPEPEGPSQRDVVDAAKLKREHPYGFKRNTFGFAELDAINKAAYWDYQRERIYFRSSANVKRAVRWAARRARVLPPNKVIECHRPQVCPRCSSADFFKHTKYSKTILDLKFIEIALMAVAIRRSISSSAGGRIWLESLPGAAGFYESLGMTRQPRRSAGGNLVYVLESAVAEQLLEKIKENRIVEP